LTEERPAFLYSNYQEDRNAASIQDFPLKLLNYRRNAMNKSIVNITSTIAAVCFLFGGQVMATETSQEDYTGLPITEAESRMTGKYVTIPASQRLSECEVVVDHFDYTGDDVTRCNPDASEPEAEWSYLY
jgi:hypothetical protein